VFEPTPLSIIMNATPVNCFGGSDGTAWVEISGGTQNYEASWNNGFFNDTLNSNLSAGTYQVDILDRNNCAISGSISVSQPLQGLSFNLNAEPVDCFGNATGLAEVLPTGGTYPYFYTWSNGATDSINENVISGNYQFTISDDNGCSLNGSVIVNQPPLLVTNIVNVDSSFCELANGSAVATATGGVSPYLFSWSNGQTTPTASNLAQGNYDVVITDANGCQNNNNVTIGNLPSPIVNASANQIVSCFGGSDGEAVASGSLGDGNYQYAWAPSGYIGSSPSILEEGEHIVYLTDGNGCQSSDTIYIGQNDLIEITSDSIHNVTCFGLSDGEIYTSTVGGIPNYSYLWSNGDITANANLLPFGQHYLTVTDDLGCEITEGFNVSQPAPLDVSIASFLDELCVNSNDGTATVNVQGGTVPYFYNWSSVPSQSTITANGLSPGVYSSIVTDNNGCIDSVSVTIGSPTPVSTIGLVDDTICYGDNITLNATGSGGAGNYIYYWNNGIGVNSSPNVSPQVETNYVVTAIDENGCSNVSDTVNIAVISLFQNDLDVFGNSPICPGLNTLIYAQIGSANPGNVVYDWSPNIGNTAGSFNVTPTAPGYYILTVSNECSVSISDSVLIEWKPIPEISIDSDLENGCEGMMANFEDWSVTSVDSIVSWYWDFGNGETSDVQNPSTTYQESGFYDISLTVTTNEGCTNDSIFQDFIEVYDLPVADFEFGQDFYSSFEMNVEFVNLSINGYSYIWDFGDGAGSTEENPFHEYDNEEEFNISLIVTSIEGCKDTAYKDLRIVEDYAMYVPNTFSPNGDGVNDIFFAEGISLNQDKFEMWIYNRWGELIFFSYKPSVGWDGTFKGVDAPIDTYVWMIKTLDDQNKLIPLRGHVNLIR
jgi:gliding motility-associated-like protein